VRVTLPSRPVVVLAAIAAVEAVALLGYAVFDLVEALRLGATGPADVSNWPAIVLQIVIFAVLGLGMALVARGWWTGGGWARAPFLLAQLFALVVGVPLAQSEGGVERVVGIVVCAMALLGLVLAFAPVGDRGSDD
jgi:hypothetical protein